MLHKDKWKDNWTVAFLTFLCLRSSVVAGISLILWVQLVSVDLSNWRGVKGKIKDGIAVLFLPKFSLLPCWRTHPRVDSPVFQSLSSWLYSSSDVNYEVEGCLRCWIPSGQVGKSTWGLRGPGGCLFSLGLDLCKTSREVSDTHLCWVLSEELCQSPSYSQCQWQGDYWGAHRCLKIYWNNAALHCL